MAAVRRRIDPCMTPLILPMRAARSVKVSSAVRKRGISGGKATGAVMTGGLSMLATGLSRKERVNALHCDNCGMTWDA